jgi:pimeloyl-ACP methyl ester carboxylesterase
MKRKMKKVMLTAVVSMIMAVCYAQSGAKENFGSNQGKYATINGVKIYYEEYGKGVPLFLLHGGLSSIRGFTNVIPTLSQHFRVIAIDAPGNGRSEQADSVSFRSMANYYSQMIDVLRLDSVYVYGFSMGAISALHLAADRPDKVKMVVAHAASNHLAGYNEGFAGTTEMTPEIVEEYASWWVEGHRQRSPQPDKWKKYILDLQRLWYPEEFISDARLKSIQADMLILQGDRDLIRFENAIHMNQLVRKSQLCILPGTSHFALWENPALVLEVVTRFLGRVPKKEYVLSY